MPPTVNPEALVSTHRPQSKHKSKAKAKTTPKTKSKTQPTQKQSQTPKSKLIKPAITQHSHNYQHSKHKVSNILYQTVSIRQLNQKLKL